MAFCYSIDCNTLVIARDNKPILKRMPLLAPSVARKPGSARGQVLYIAPDFDATPDGFKDNV